MANPLLCSLFAFASTFFLLTTEPAADACVERFPFGTVTLATSDHAAGSYGADFSLLYGAWSWSGTFGLSSDVAKSSYYVRAIAELARDCIGDPRAGRLSFARRSIAVPDGPPRGETDEEYFDRIFDELVELRRQLALIENGFPQLMAQHAPLVPQADLLALKNVINQTLLRVLQLSANRSTGIGWIVEQMQALTEAQAQFLSALGSSRALIATYLLQYPQLRSTIISSLKNNTSSVLDQYGQFFSPARRDALQALLHQLDEQEDEEDLPALIANLSSIADQLEGQARALREGPVVEISSKLKYIFGGCDSPEAAHPLTSAQYFGDLPVANLIVQEGSHAAFCTP